MIQMRNMKAITIHPEWAFAICHLGKDVENRSWQPRLDVGAHIAIHAGRLLGGSHRIDAQTAIDLVCQSSNLARVDVAEAFELQPINAGKIVAVAKLGSFTDSSASPWAAAGYLHWELEDVEVLPNPISCRGHQSIWTVPPGIVREVEEQLRASRR